MVARKRKIVFVPRTPEQSDIDLWVKLYNQGLNAKRIAEREDVPFGRRIISKTLREALGLSRLARRHVNGGWC